MKTSFLKFRYLFLFAVILQQAAFSQRVIGRFETLSVEQGLSQNTVKCVLQDQRGFMWFGTEGGLNRYDGADFVVFRHDPEDSSSLSNNIINDMARGADDRFWIATANGLCRYNPERANFSRFLVKNKKFNQNFSKLLVEKSHNVWLKGADGLCRFDIQKMSFNLFKLEWLDQSLKLLDFKVFNKDSLLLATDSGLFYFNKDSGELQPAQWAKSLTNRPVNLILKGRAGEWWFQTIGGLVFYNSRNRSAATILEHSKVEKVLNRAQGTFIHQDRDGHIWLGYSGSGLSCYNPQDKSLKHLQPSTEQKGGVSSNYFLSVYEDEGGLLWFGTLDAGAIKLSKNNKGFEHYKIENKSTEKLNHNVVLSFAEGEAGDIWVGTMGGLVRFDFGREKFSFINSADVNKGQALEVHALAFDERGRLWVGTYDKGLYYLDKESGLLQKYQGAINSRANFKKQIIYKIIQDNKNQFWLGASNGLFSFSPLSGKYKHFVHNPSDSTSLGANFVRDLYLDGDDNLWIATMGGGLNKFIAEEEKFIRYTNDPSNPHSISNDQVTSICQDSVGCLWLGTNGGGLIRFDPGSEKFWRLSRHHRLNGELLYDLVPFGRHFWISSARGLFRFNWRRQNTLSCDKYMGLQSSEFNAGAALKLKSGQLLFGGINGFNVVNPDKLQKNKHIPIVNIIDIKIYDQSYGLKRLDDFIPLEGRLPEENNIYLNHRQNSFTINFAAMDFEAPQNNVYVYRLLNFDKKWFFAIENRQATFTNIPPGEYIFEVKGSNNDRLWNTRSTKLNITITPPFWQTNWLLTLVVVLAVSLLYFLYRLRIHYIKEKNKALEAINQKLNAEVAVRQRTEKALNESERRLATLIKNLPGIAYRCKNNERRTMEFVSEGCIAVTGYRPENFVQGKRLHYTDLVHPEDRDGMLMEIEERLFKKSSFQVVYRIISSTRQIKWVWEQGRGIYDEQGDIIAVEGFIIDISERKQLEEQLVQAQKMEAVGHLAGGIAHDFSNLLTIIRGYSELSLVMLDKGLPVYKKVVEINKAVDRAESLTQQLLAFSRKQVLKPVPVSLNKQINETEKMLRRVIGEHIQLNLILEAKPDTIKADPGKIEQIILNLAINARDAMPEGGTLTLSTSNVILDDDFSGFRPELKAGRYVMLNISDTGTGMDEQTKEHIFDPFFTTKGSGKGTGLGLATVYGIVKQSSGHVTVTSQQGSGTTFMIYFPLVRDEIIENERDEKLQGELRGSETILLAEDKKEVREVIYETLSSLGYNVLPAAHGKSAIDIFSKHKDSVSLLITDIIMPGMNGKTLATKLLDMKPSLKIIYMSGYTDNSLGEDGNLEQGTHFIQKPFNTHTLAKILREALD